MATCNAGWRRRCSSFTRISRTRALIATAVAKGQAGRLPYVTEFLEAAKASGLVPKAIESAGLRGVQLAALSQAQLATPKHFPPELTQHDMGWVQAIQFAILAIAPGAGALFSAANRTSKKGA